MTLPKRTRLSAHQQNVHLLNERHGQIGMDVKVDGLEPRAFGINPTDHFMQNCFEEKVTSDSEMNGMHSIHSESSGKENDDDENDSSDNYFSPHEVTAANQMFAEDLDNFDNINNNEFLQFQLDDTEIRNKEVGLMKLNLFSMVMTTIRKNCAYNPNTLSSVTFPPSLMSNNLNFGLEQFLSSQGIEPYPSMKTSEDQEYYVKVRDLLERYTAELNKLNRLCDDFCNKTIQVLQCQGVVRSVTQYETDLRIALIKKQFDRVRTQLRQNVCNALLTLQKHYGQGKRKRRSLSKLATDTLNQWFFAHLHDPYPSDEEKILLATQGGVTISQVNNWFGNKRIRYKRRCLELNGKQVGSRQHAGSDQEDADLERSVGTKRKGNVQESTGTESSKRRKTKT